MRITREEAKTYLEIIKKVTEQSTKLDDVLREMSPDFGGFGNELAIDVMVSMLKVLTNDLYDWIEYYIWELDWGKEYKEGSITTGKGENIPLKTIDDLLDLLEENEENKNEAESLGIN
nr:MAG TPA: hypothetical protein [Caudoviricetes sp.]